MMQLPHKCIVDTNVPVSANLVNNPQQIPVDMKACALECVEAIEYIMKNGMLVIDEQDEICREYRKYLSSKGQPGVGDIFMKWILTHSFNTLKIERVRITKNGASYNEFPDHADLVRFDNADRKFVAVSNAHPEKPSIVQATDSKWWGWKEALDEVGIKVIFLAPDYIRNKYEKKTRS